MHIPNPLAIARPSQRALSYFRAGVRVEGEAFLTDSPRVFVLMGGGSLPDRVPQHVSVELKFWASRGDPVTIIDIARASIPLYGVELSDFGDFESVTLEPGQKPVELLPALPKGEPRSTGRSVDRLDP